MKRTTVYLEGVFDTANPTPAQIQDMVAVANYDSINYFGEVIQETSRNRIIGGTHA